MAPTPLLSKGNTSTLARKWRKLKKRCSSFSSGDNLNAAMVRTKSVTSNDCQIDDDDADDDESISADVSRMRNFRDKWDKWNRRHSGSQGDSIAQWWQWQGSSPPPSSCTGSRPVARSTSLKGDLGQRPRNGHEDEDEDDEVFVTADPLVRAMQSGQVKSAMIVSASNPYCTGARTKKHTTSASARSSYFKSKQQEAATSSGESSITTSPSPSPTATATTPISPDPKVSTAAAVNPNNNSSSSSPNSISFCHDQDSGYDGYCPADKSITSIGGSSSSASSSEETNASSLEESHYGNASYTRLAAKDIYGRIGTAVMKSPGAAVAATRPQSVYEKHYGPVQHCLESKAKAVVYSSPRSQISQATVVNLVSSKTATLGSRPPPLPINHHRQEPPPLPPRPANLFTTSGRTLTAATTNHVMSASLPRSRRSKKLLLASVASVVPETDQRRPRENGLYALQSKQEDEKEKETNQAASEDQSRRVQEQQQLLLQQQEQEHNKQMDANLKVCWLVLEAFVRLRNDFIRITVNLRIIRTVNRITDSFS
jgi:hypothetical protein